MGLQGKTNFFEKRVGEYQKAGVVASSGAVTLLSYGCLIRPILAISGHWRVCVGTAYVHMGPSFIPHSGCVSVLMCATQEIAKHREELCSLVFARSCLVDYGLGIRVQGQLGDLVDATCILTMNVGSVA